MKVKALGMENGVLRSVCVSEDARMRVWLGDQCVSEVLHPNSLWDVDYQMVEEGGKTVVNLLTACSDGVREEVRSEE